MGIRVTPKEFPKEIRARFKGIPRELQMAMRSAAMMGQTVLADATPRATGRTAARWKVQGNTRRGFSLYNPAPHVGILELGARPHPVNQAGMRALRKWARTVLGVSSKDAKRIANAIAWKLRHHGQKPTYFVRNSIPRLQKAVAGAVKAQLRSYSRKKARKR